MRRTLLVILVFVPAVAAGLIFRTWRNDEAGHLRRTRRAASDGATGRGEDLHAATGGAETFFIRMGTAEIDGALRDYRSAYYYLGKWRRTAVDRFEADRTLVVLNPGPRTAADLEDLLVIRNDEPAARRHDRLHAAARTLTSLRAGRALITGGSSIETADDILFFDGVTGRVAERPGTFDPIDLRTAKAHLLLDAGRVSSVELPEHFQLTRRDFDLRGAALTADDAGHVAVARSPDMKLGRLDDAPPGDSRWRVTLAARGPFEYTADSTGGELGALDRIRLDGGRITVEGDVILRIGDFTFHADRMEGHLRPRVERSTRSTRLERIEMTGHVRIVTADGEIAGDHAAGDLLDGDAVDAVVDGRPVTVTWSAARARLGSDGQPRRVHASCRGRLHVKKPARDAVDEPLELTLDESVTVVIRRGEEIDLDLASDRLAMTLMRLPSTRPGAGDDERAWRLTRAVADRDVTGVSRGSTLAARTVTLDRRHDGHGLHTRDDLLLESDAVLVLDRTRGAETGVERAVRVEAAERIEVRRAASPFDDSTVAARGDVHARWEIGGEPRDELDAGSIDLTVGPPADADAQDADPGARLKSFTARSGVVFRRAGGSTASGEEATFSRERDEVAFTGTPARLEHVDPEGRRQRFRAPNVRLLRRAGRAMATGGVDAEIVMPVLVTTAEQRAAEREADENLDERPSRDVTWRVVAAEMTATFTAGLPLDARSGETRLREIEATGNVHAENPTQTLDADRIFHDFNTGTGSGEGAPLVATITRAEAEGTWIDRVEGARITTNPDWTLFTGPCHAVFHVAREKEAAGLEPLEVRCEKDVLVRERSIYFGGRTHAERGAGPDPWLVVDAGSAVAHFAAERPGSARDLERLDGHDDVAFTWKDLSGSGDLVSFDHARRRVVLKAYAGKCRMDLRGFTTTNEMVTYDMDDETVTGTRLEGVAREARKEGR